MDEKEKKIIVAVDSLAEQAVDFASRLVKEGSILGKEASVVQVMEKELAGLGLTPRRVPILVEEMAGHPGFAPAPWSYAGRDNVVAFKPADGSGGRSALFNGHLDVVSPEPVRFWDRDPFEALIQDGWLYGRGSGDMKAGVAAMTYAVHAVGKAGFGLKAPVTISAVIEEECTGNGALATVLAGYDAEAVLIPEPFGPTIYLAQVGVLWFKVTVKGAATHVQAAPAGTNAIEKSFLLISALRDLEKEMNQDLRPEIYQDFFHPLNLNIGIMSGGDWPSTVPAETEFHCRMSYFPGVSFKEVAQTISDRLRKAAQEDSWLSENPPQIEFYGFRSDGHIIDRRQPALMTLSHCHQDLTGQQPKEYVSTCTTDLRTYHFFGQGQGTCFGPVAENIHGANERVNIDSIIHVARTYALFLARWCGLAD